MSVPHHRDELSDLLARYRQEMLAYIFAIVRDHHLAEDVFQETSVVLMNQWETLDHQRDLWRYARGVARRQALARLRAHVRGTEIPEEAVDAIDRGFAATGPQEDHRLGALERCLEKLPPVWLQIVRLRYWEERSVITIAEMLGRSVNTVSVTLNRVRSRLTDCVNEVPQEETR